MQTAYQARWVSKRRAEELKKSGAAQRGVLLDSFNGYIIVEPAGADLGDGNTLSREEADYELQSAWCISPLPRLTQARRLLGLEGMQTATATAGA